MPETKFVLLPKNLCEEKRFNNKTIYTTDYSGKRPTIPERRWAKKKETPSFAGNVNDPCARFINDHYETSSHGKLKRQCKKVLNNIERSSSRISTPRGHQRVKSASVYNGAPLTSELNDDDTPLLDVLPPSLRKIESAWQQEFNTTKRERDTIYGNAGTKKWFKQRQEEKSKRNSDSMLIPGLRTWLDEANEYEKQAVRSFMKNCSKAVKEDRKSPEPLKVKLDVRHEKQFYSDDPKIEDYMDEINDHSEIDRVLSPPFFQNDHYEAIDEQLSPYPLEMQQTPLALSQDNLLQEIDQYKNVHFRNPTRETILPQKENKLLQGRESSSSFESFESNTLKQTQPRQGAKSAMATSTHKIQYHDDKPRPKSSPGIYNEQQKLESRPKSSLSSASSTHRLVPGAKTVHTSPRAETPEVVQKIFLNSPSRNQSARNHTPEVDQQIFSNSTLRSHCATKKRTTHSHNDASCLKCMDREIKKMAEKLSEIALDSYGKSKKEKHNMSISRMYNTPLVDYGFTNEDYVHKYSVFGDSATQDRGYYIIHPEWVSERSKPRKNYKVIGCYH